MLVVGDEAHDRGKLPWMTFTLIALNFTVFAAQMRFGEPLTLGYALVPLEITEGRDLAPNSVSQISGTDSVVVLAPGSDSAERVGKVFVPVSQYPGPSPIYLTLLSYQFLHGGILHLAFNMWFLFVFGRNVECALGSWRFLWFYLFCGVLAGLAQVGISLTSTLPIVGASGSIAGTMGAYLAIHPWNKLKVCVGMLVGIPAGVVQIPAFLFVGIWILGEAAFGWMTEDQVGGGTAYFCHVGGFLAGFFYIKALAASLGLRVRMNSEAKDAPLEVAVEDPVAAYRRSRDMIFSDARGHDDGRALGRAD